MEGVVPDSVDQRDPDDSSLWMGDPALPSHPVCLEMFIDLSISLWIEILNRPVWGGCPVQQQKVLPLVEMRIRR